MKNKFFWLNKFLLTIFCSNMVCVVYGQDSYLITESTVPYVIYNEETVNQYIYTIRNITDNNIWILLEKDPSIDNRKLIVTRFKQKSTGMSLFDFMICETDWTDFKLKPYNNFFKILSPNDEFSFIFTNSAIYDSFKESIRIMTAEEMAEIFKPLLIIDPDTKPSYQPNVIYLVE